MSMFKCLKIDDELLVISRKKTETTGDHKKECCKCTLNYRVTLQ